MKPHSLLLLAALALVAADKQPRPETPKKSGAKKPGQKKSEQELIQGKWRYSEFWLDCRVQKKVNGIDPSRVVLTFTGNQVTMAVKGRRPKKGTFKLDSTKKPGRITLVFDFVAIEQIYKIEKDTLTMCLAPLGEPLPKNFTRRKGQLVKVLKRIPKKKPQPKKD